MDFEIKDYLLKNGYMTEFDNWTEFFKGVELNSVNEAVADIRCVELVIDEGFLSKHIDLEEGYDYKLEVTASNWEDGYTYEVTLTAIDQISGAEYEHEIPVDEDEACDIYFAICETVSQDMEGYISELKTRSGELLKDTDYLEAVYSEVLNLNHEKYDYIIDNDRFYEIHNQLLKRKDFTFLFDIIGEFSVESETFEFDLQNRLEEKGLRWEDALMYRKPHFIEAASVREDFKAALCNTDNIYEVSDKLDFSLSDHDVSVLALLHKNGDNLLKAKIESLLESCNFHVDCAKFACGDYKEYITNRDDSNSRDLR